MIIVEKARGKIRQHLVLQSASYMLGRLGLLVMPYYVCREAIDRVASPHLPQGFESGVAAFLSPTGINRLYLHEECRGLEKEKNEFLNEGSLCFALRRDGEVLSYGWCIVGPCKSKFASFQIPADGAYIFRAMTFSSFRGKNLAPFLRSRLYDELHQMGVTKLFSVTECFNYPAVQFKKKVNARIVRLGLLITLFNRSQWHFTLRDYKD